MKPTPAKPPKKSAKKTPAKAKKKPAKKAAKSAPQPVEVVTKPSGFHWGIALLLGFIIGASLLLRTAEIITPPPVAFTTHPLDDDTAARLRTIESTYPKLTQPPRIIWSNEPLTIISTKYLLLLDGSTAKEQLAYFEKSISAIIASKELPKPKEELAATPVVQTNSINVPILMYHRTPGDFEKQISHLATRGYTAIGFGELVAAIKNKSSLPAKPVIITLDDGYADQMAEVGILREYNMKATMYVINGGEASRWCIGAGAKGLPGCEGYLNWDQIRKLDREGLVTIGSHTINHPNLASLTYDQQRAEIAGGKQQLEAQLGHPVLDFAYPYGSFNGASIQIAQQVGFRSAVSTIDGTVHSLSTLFTLRRVRDSLVLP